MRASVACRSFAMWTVFTAYTTSASSGGTFRTRTGRSSCRPERSSHRSPSPSRGTRHHGSSTRFRWQHLSGICVDQKRARPASPTCCAQAMGRGFLLHTGRSACAPDRPKDGHTCPKAATAFARRAPIATGRYDRTTAGTCDKARENEDQGVNIATPTSMPWIAFFCLAPSKSRTDCMYHARPGPTKPSIRIRRKIKAKIRSCEMSRHAPRCR